MNKPRRLFLLLLSFVLVLSACSRATTQTPAPADTPSPTPTPVESVEVVESPEVSEEPGFVADPNASVALITSGAGIFFERDLWAGIQSFCSANDKACWSYVDTHGGPVLTNAVESIIADDNKIIVACGGQFEAPFYDLHEEYPDVAFILFDGNIPLGNAAVPNEPGNNVVYIQFDEAQIGYLAGYAAVSDGYTKLGFLGQLDAATYGYGFVQGANDAAESLGITADILYYYTNSGYGNSMTEIQEMANLWYQSGIQLIFSASSVEHTAVIAAAEENERKVITTEGPLDQLSAAVIATCGKDAGQVVSRLLTAYYSGRFPGGENQTLGCNQQAVSLDISRMAKFGQYDYEHVYGKLAAGTVVPLGPADAESPEQLPCPNVKVNLIEGGQNDG